MKTQVFVIASFVCMHCFVSRSWDFVSKYSDNVGFARYLCVFVSCLPFVSFRMCFIREFPLHFRLGILRFVLLRNGVVVKLLYVRVALHHGEL